MKTFTIMYGKDLSPTAWETIEAESEPDAQVHAENMIALIQKETDGLVWSEPVVNNAEILDLWEGEK